MPWLADLGQDFRYALRLLRKSPLFTVTAIGTLALAIGANTALFSVANGALFRPLPYKDPQRLIVIWDRPAMKDAAPIFASYHDFEQYRLHATTLTDVSVATWATEPRVWTRGQSARTLLALPTSVGFFDLLGVHAARGRTFRTDDEARPCAVVLSHGFWQSKLQQSTGAVGDRLVLDGTQCAIVGIMPASFSFYPRQADLWMLAGPAMKPPREKMIVGIFAHRRPGVTLAQVQAEVSALHHSLHEVDKDEREIEPAVFNLQQNFTFLAGRTLQQTVELLAGALLFLLLIACLNVASLLTGRALVRNRELALRAALGSGKARLIRQLLTESLLLSTVATILGLAIAWATVRYFLYSHPIELPVGARIGLDGTTLLFSSCLAVVTTVLFGLWPAFSAARVDLNEVLKAAGRGRAQQASQQRFTRAAVAIEMAITVVLLLGANLLAASMLHMQDEALGFNPHRLMFMNIALKNERYRSEQQKTELYNRLWRRLREVGLGASFAIGSNSPLYGGGSSALDREGQAPQRKGALGDVGRQQVSPGYFETMNTRLLSGRDYDQRDGPSAERVAIVNDALAREYFPATSAIGRKIRIADDPAGPWLTIIGVAENEKHTELMHEMSWVATPVVFESILQSPSSSGFIFVRTSDASVTRRIQSTIAALDSQIPVNEAETMDASLSTTLSFSRFRTLLVGAIALAAMLLAAVGLHGFLAQTVARRIPEFGIRMAIGGTARDVFLLVARDAGMPLIAGLALGFCLAFVFLRVMTGLLYGVRVGDPAAIAAMMLLLTAGAACAIAVPAWRAVRVDPAVALRDE